MRCELLAIGCGCSLVSADWLLMVGHTARIRHCQTPSGMQALALLRGAWPQPCDCVSAVSVTLCVIQVASYTIQYEYEIQPYKMGLNSIQDFVNTRPIHVNPQHCVGAADDATAYT